MTGTFITIEGPEGAGKTTILRGLATRLAAPGREIISTREPGGAPEAESLRALLLAPSAQWSALAEALLMNAARTAHVEQTILPALDRGATVLCDRFVHSTRAYQGAGGGVDMALLRSIEQAVVTRPPDFTLFLLVPAEIGLGRSARRGALDRIEQQSTDYHRRVASAFAEMSVGPQCAGIDATASPDDVLEAALQVLGAALPGLLP